MITAVNDGMTIGPKGYYTLRKITIIAEVTLALSVPYKADIEFDEYILLEDAEIILWYDITLYRII